MDCSGYNQNAHYHNRNGRNMSNGNMNVGRSTCGNVMQSRKTCGNMDLNRNYRGNMNSRRNNECMNRSETRECENREREEREKCECMDKDMRDEGCDRGREPVDEMMPAMSYVPWQKWEDIYCMEEALERGTIFAQLDKPYIGRMAK